VGYKADKGAFRARAARPFAAIKRLFGASAPARFRLKFAFAAVLFCVAVPVPAAAASGDAIRIGRPPAPKSPVISAEASADSHEPDSGAVSSPDPPTNGEPPPTENRVPVPGTLIADTIEYSPDGVVTASGGVVFESPGLVPDGTVRLSASELVFDTKTGLIESEGAVTFEIVETGVYLTGERLTFSINDRTGGLDGVSGSVPVERGAGFPPSRIFILEGDLTVDASGGETKLMLRGAKFSTYPYDDTDFFISVKSAELVTGEYFTLKKVSATASGYRIFYWPHVRESLIESEGAFRSVFPTLGYSGDDGARVFYRPEYTIGPFTTQFNLDYWTKRGLLPEFDHYATAGDFRFGVKHGEVWARDVRGDTAIFRERINAYVAFEREYKRGPVKSLESRIEAGRIKQIEPDLTGERYLAEVDLSFREHFFSERAFIGTGAGVAHREYRGLPSDRFTVYTGRLTLGKRHLFGTDKVELRWHPKQGEAAFRFDDLYNELELTGVKHVRVSEKWMAVGTALYDFDNSEFDQLSLEIRRLNKAYTIGAAWDFALGSGFLTFDVRMW
jgi:hypothetical protein